MPKTLTLDLLKREASQFAIEQTRRHEKSLFGITDGKAVGTFIEHTFQRRLHEKYEYDPGSSAKGIDFPTLGVDLKTTSIQQPQSSCPFRSARQKIYGLGYHLLVLVYEKIDDAEKQASRLKILHTLFIDKAKTADFQTTSGIRKLLENGATVEDLVGFFTDRMLPADEIQIQSLAEEVIGSPPEIGCLTISNALQWRLQYSRAIAQAGDFEGVEKL